MDKLLLALPENGNRVVGAALVEAQTGMSKDFNDFELQAALAQRDVFRANQIVKYYQGNPRSFFIGRTPFGFVWIQYSIENRHGTSAMKNFRKFYFLS